MNGILRNICISGISTAIPETIEKNIGACAYLGERRCKRQIKLTGVDERRVSPEGQKISDLCYVAALHLMQKLAWDPEEIRALVLLTQTPDFKAPSTAFLLQKMLHIPTDCIVFDVNLGCSAFNVGLQIVSSLLSQFEGSARGICLIGDIASQTIVPGCPADEMAGNMLFGSAGSAVAIEKGGEKHSEKSIPFCTFSDGNGYQTIQKRFNGKTHMDGEGVFNFSTDVVPRAIERFWEANHLADENIDYYVFHQAQKMILDSLARTCRIQEDKELRSIKSYGNTSGASIPLSLCANQNRFSNVEEVRVFTCGFGVGLSWSMAYMTLPTELILPPIESNAIF